MSDLETSPAASPDALPAWRRYLSIAGSVMLGLVFLVAAWAKSIDPESFASQIRGEGLEILLPASAIALFALFLEWALGVALVLAVRWRW
ncbi:MAG: MauE/DoxX family redox-associated membrane protein, partial [Acidobacteriota bacterium]